MARRPAAHNPMIFRKVPRPAGAVCPRGCGGFVRAGTACDTCAFNAALLEVQAEIRAEAERRVPDPARDDIGIEPWEELVAR